jgi:hypothetical protein
MKHPSQGLVCGMILLALLFGLTGGSLYSDEPLEAKVLRRVSQEQGIAPERLALGSLSLRLVAWSSGVDGPYPRDPGCAADLARLLSF